MRLLVAYFIGGFGLSLIIGAVAVFVLKGAGFGQKAQFPGHDRIVRRTATWPTRASAFASGLVDGAHGGR